MEQIGGYHYQYFKIQPIELITMCNWNFIQGNIAKYVLRYKHKNGIEDLRKAKTYCELCNCKRINESLSSHTIIEVFCRINELDVTIEDILLTINEKDYMRTEDLINYLIQKEGKESI